MTWLQSTLQIAKQKIIEMWGRIFEDNCTGFTFLHYDNALGVREIVENERTKWLFAFLLRSRISSPFLFHPPREIERKTEFLDDATSNLSNTGLKATYYYHCGYRTGSGARRNQTQIEIKNPRPYPQKFFIFEVGLSPGTLIPQSEIKN
jgi:hypothetical protein